MARKNKSRHQRAKEKITTFVNQLRSQKDKHVLEIEKMKKEMNEICDEKIRRRSSSSKSLYPKNEDGA